MVQNSNDIIIFGAGLYSFFQNFGQACLDSNSCQSQILSIDTGSTIWVYSLSTLGVTSQLSIGDQGIIPENQNANGFQVCVFAQSQVANKLTVLTVDRYRLDPLSTHHLR